MGLGCMLKRLVAWIWNLYVNFICCPFFCFVHAYLQRAVVTMSRETEKNISQILQDVRRHSDASQTGFTGASDAVETNLTSSDSCASSSATSMTGSASASQLQDFDDSLSTSVWTGTKEEGYTGMETELSMTDQTGMTSSASLSSMDFVDSRGSSVKGSGKLFFVDNNGDSEGRSAIEQEVRQQREETDKLNEALKAELEEKEENNARYKKMMVSWN